jgi:VWFA-related protein
MKNTHRLRNTLIEAAAGTGVGAGIGAATYRTCRNSPTPYGVIPTCFQLWKRGTQAAFGAAVGLVSGTLIGALWPSHGIVYRMGGTGQECRNGWTLRPLRRLAIIVALFSTSTLSPQQAPSPQSPAQTPIVRVTTHLVLVDVVVYDKQGNHVTNLTAADFTLRDHGKPQKISVFSDDRAGESLAEKSNSALPPPLPPGVFTNRPEFHRQEGPPVILLLDSLNTAIGDQQSSRDQMLQYLRTQLNEGQKIAILALNQSLELLQDFTTDPHLLIAALDKNEPGTSNELSGATIQTFTPREAAALSPSMLRFIDRNNQSRAAESTDARVRTTLDALRSIARAFGGFPGRKNLIWVSAVFPFSLHPGEGGYPDAQRDYGEDIRRTAALLAAARVAVYTVDARSLLVGSNVYDQKLSPAPDPLVQTVRPLDNHQTTAEELANSHDATLNSHETMQDLAAETGGLALYNRNDIIRAVSLSAADGSRYYTLGYYPEGRWDGKFHRIEIKISRDDVKARHRSGYFAVDVAQSSASETPQQRDRRAYDELRTALAAPLPATQVTFRVHIPDPQPAARAQVQIQFLVDAASISFDAIENGQHHCNLDFMVAAVSADGKIIAAGGHTVDARLKPDHFAQANQNGLPFSMQLPLAPGTYSLRFAVRDNRTGLMGTVIVPLLVPGP